MEENEEDKKEDDDEAEEMERKMRDADFQFLKDFPQKIVKFSAKIGFLIVQIKNNFKNIIFIACK